ncbi:hypothetical protein CVT24_003202 [Panaeolus cyanescens]|uniref:MalT-like TPR region domain-containing protein n=1 Tax=Panaeolus cyanescens TaxID=181874 RepID=A0A409W8E1_9AGAR|nr:hypothetical protein CVT24_003202 [Panaeolus cyanescens]
MKEPEPALRHAEIAFYISRDVLKNTQLASDCQCIKARALALNEKYEEAVKEADRVIEFYEKTGVQGRGTASGAYIYNVKTRALKGAQQWGPGLVKAATHAIKMCQSYGSPLAVGEALLEYGELLVEAEKWEGAKLVFEEASKEFKRLDVFSAKKVVEECNQNLAYVKMKAENATKIKYIKPARC